MLEVWHYYYYYSTNDFFNVFFGKQLGKPDYLFCYLKRLFG